jgi:anthranilate synthase/aminodeoxychorismate synthase-like glutamine amidotransferase
MGARVLVIDNYDSFVYNLVQELGELGALPVVHRNDAIDVEAIRRAGPDAILLSPGPGRPEEAGITLEVVAAFAGTVPILGVCLGHQAIAQAFGGVVVQAPALMHGKTSEIHHCGTGIFEGLPDPLVATRYHSLVVTPGSVPKELAVTATAPGGVVMGLRHRTLAVEGVQFHPESILTATGPAMLANFLARLPGADPAAVRVGTHPPP